MMSAQAQAGSGQSSSKLNSGNLLGNAIRGLDLTVDLVVAAAILAELFVTLADSTLRDVADRSLLFETDVNDLALSVIAFVGGAIAYRRGQHIAVSMLVNRLPARARSTVAAAVQSFTIAICVASIYASIPLIRSEATQQLTSLNISRVWLYVPMIAGFGLIALYAAVALCELHRPWRELGLASVVVVLAVVTGLHAQVDYYMLPTQTSQLVVVLIVFAFLLLLAMPIAFAMMVCALAYTLITQSLPLSAMPTQMQDGVSASTLLAAPFFILAGLLMTSGGISTRISDLARLLLHRFRGAPLQVTIASMFFFALASVPVLKLFVAGILPALLLAVGLMLIVFFRSRKSGISTSFRPELEGRFARTRTVLSAIPGLCVPLLLITGIALGYATPTEVSSWAVVLAVVISVALYRSLSFRGLFDALRRTSDMAGMLLFIFAASSGFSFVLTVLGTSNMIASWVNDLGRHPTLFLCVAAIALLILGAVLEGVPALVILGPLLLPVAVAQGVNLIQFSIVLIVAMGLGSFTPPIGVGIYAACLVTDTKLEPVARRFWPYFAVLLAGLIVLALVPQVSLAL